LPKAESKNQSFSIFLIREGVRTEDAIKPGLQKVAVKDLGDLHYKQNPRRPPKWLAFFEERLVERPPLYSASNGAVLTVKRGKRIFALSFGVGRHLLKPGATEESFGLKVTLNSVDPKRLKSVDRKTFDAISCHTRTQASQPGDVTAFGLNVEQDLLRAATGSPLEPLLGVRMTGMDALLVTVPVTLNGIPSLLDSYLTQFRSDEYKKTFPWVDHIGEVRGPQLRDHLDEQLLSLIRTSDPSDISAWLAVPELIEWAEIGGFRYKNHDDEDLHADLHIRDFLATVSDAADFSVESLRHRHVYAYDAQDETWVKRWTVYNCLYGEIERDETTYLLSGGKWYRVDRDFVATVNRSVARLVEDGSLPPYADKSEEEYNKRVARASSGKTALLDRKLIRVGGTSVEFCDLYTADRHIIHVKRYGGSSVLSHLFAQGSVAANAFLEEETFRAAVNLKLPPSHRVKNPKRRPDASRYEVHYAIVSRSKKRIDHALPFFSRLNLRNAARQLRGFGFKVVLSKIESQ
jgi:uncharacterized protein (TIGR04141 family)